ncbi:MAG: PEP-CTERM sorting domain-containing protein [Sphingomonas sp.]|nr:PEP-CTERM sorting domain-containing protein [Sphingomonas sp.]
MDPTSSACSVGVVTSNDLAAIDAMGWNINTDIYNNRGYTFTTAQAFALSGAAHIAAGVPEPASWAMMLFGFGAIGGAMRSRRKLGISFG